VDVIVERSSITQSVQIGVETVSGTAVAAGKRLGSMGFKVGPSIDPKPLMVMGAKHPTLIIPGKELTEADISGSAVYTELPYAFSSVISAPVVTAIMDAAIPTLASKWVFTSNTFGDDAPKTFTVEQGSAFRAHRFANGIITEYTWSWSREEIELGGTMIGRAIEDGVTLTAAPTLLPQIPVRPAELSVYIDTSAVGLGTTKQLRTLKGECNISDRFEPLWVVDAAQASFVSTVEGEPTIEFKITQMADTQSAANLVAMRNGTTRFLRLEAVGPVIYTSATPLTVTHRCRWDVAGQVVDVKPFEDEDGVFAIEYTFRAIHDPVWAKAYEVEVITTTTAL
jgi:hypothetical protein